MPHLDQSIASVQCEAQSNDKDIAHFWNSALQCIREIKGEQSDSSVHWEWVKSVMITSKPCPYFKPRQGSCAKRLETEPILSTTATALVTLCLDIFVDHLVVLF